MRSSPSQVRLLVMVLVAWCALSAAPVVANSPALPAAFFVIAVGLVAAVTLRFSTLVGLGMAVLGTALFAISVVLDPTSGASRSGVQGLAGALSRLDQLLPALIAAVSLVGAAVCASLASWEIDGRPGAILEPVGADEESDRKLEQHASVVEPAAESRESPAAVQAVAAAPPPAPPAEAPGAKEEPAVQQGVQEVAPEPAVLEEPVAQREPATAPPAEQPPAAIPEPAAAEETAALRQPEGERVVAREESRVDEGPVRGGDEPAAEAPAAVEESAVREESATAAKGSPVDEPAVADEPSPAAEPASTVSPESGGAVKGEEIAAGELEERNGRPQGDQVEAARPDWRRRRRPDDDVARRLPRRRKR